MVRIEKVQNENHSLSMVQLRLLFFAIIFSGCLLPSLTSWSAMKAIQNKQNQTGCNEEYFAEFERRAKLEVSTFHLGNKFRADLVEFVSLLDERKQEKLVFCGYSSDDYLTLLFHASATMAYIREKTGPFPPDTFIAFADKTLNRLWNDGFRSGRHSFPKNRNQISCLRNDVLKRLNRCEKLNATFFTRIRKLKLPKGWELPR
jgi:hypothetical protein